MSESPPPHVVWIPSEFNLPDYTKTKVNFNNFHEGMTLPPHQYIVFVSSALTVFLPSIPVFCVADFLIQVTHPFSRKLLTPKIWRKECDWMLSPTLP